MTVRLRNTRYAKELKPAAVFKFPDGTEGRVEYLSFKAAPVAGETGYRFSWWKKGRMAPRPLDFTEKEFVDLMKIAVKDGVFSKRTLASLRALFRKT